MSQIFEVTLTTHRKVLMEAENADEAKECMRIRCCHEISEAEDSEITADPVTVKPEDQSRILRP